MHDWSNDKVDWKGISDAAHFIGTNLRRWGRVSVSDMKEKYGTPRVYCSFGWHQLHSITHPGHAYSRYPKWLWHIDCLYISKLMWLVNWAVVPLQYWLYTCLYGRALKKWPHLREEILAGASYSELLTKYGVHRVRTAENCYTIYYDWHPDNWTAKNPPTEED